MNENLTNISVKGKEALIDFSKSLQNELKSSLTEEEKELYINMVGEDNILTKEI